MTTTMSAISCVGRSLVNEEVDKAARLARHDNAPDNEANAYRRAPYA
jgi:hypothetical protein